MIPTIRRKLRLAWRSLPVPVRSRLLGWFSEPESAAETASAVAIETERFRAGVPSIRGLLEHLRENGFSPFAIVDVGANVGAWSRTAAAVFPSARIAMFDGDPENEPALQAAARTIGSGAAYFLRLLGPNKEDAVTLLRPDSGTTGSSVLPELTSFAKESVTLPMDTLDTLTDWMGLQPPLLLKLDVQGFELEVLKGGRRTLGLSEVVILETSLLPYNQGAPLFAEVVAFMSDAGFVAYDFCGQLRRETDHALFQTDIVFVPRESRLRAPRKFWLSEPEAKH